jgi:hypothetical protein
MEVVLGETIFLILWAVGPSQSKLLCHNYVSPKRVFQFHPAPFPIYKWEN